VTGRFVVEAPEPGAVRAAREGTLADRVTRARRVLRDCRICPRDCGVDRTAGAPGVCGIGRRAHVSSAFPHHGEEDCLRGWGGSGTIFFCGCALRCVFCQNWEISQRAGGRACSAEDLASMMLGLQRAGCHNVNLVTPGHVVPQIVEALAIAVPAGLRLPLVYNTGGYDGPEALALMDGLVDVYMPDFKFWEPETARRLSRAAGYPEAARAAIAEMHRQVGVLVTDRAGIAVRGVLVRHLVVPGLVEETAAIMRWLAGSLSPDTFVNLMGQYRPAHRVPGNPRYAGVDRRPTAAEMADAYAAARAAGLHRFAA
jgi:putative pyruvate formate lyase activating enzyme